MIIDIPKEVNLSVLLCDGSQVKDQHGNRWSKIHLQVIFAVMHGLLNSFQVPAGSVAENISCKLVGILQMDAPMACHPF
jgi:hypothetical protein